MIMINEASLDTNVLIYLHHIQSSSKRLIAQELIAANPVICTQVISEYLNVCRKKFRMPKRDIFDALLSWLPFCNVSFPINTDSYKFAYRLQEKYDLQLFDSIIVASSLEAGCKVLSSEDMQHAQLIENQLKIINPFR